MSELEMQFMSSLVPQSTNCETLELASGLFGKLKIKVVW